MQKMTKQCTIKISRHSIRQKYDAIKNGTLILTSIPSTLLQQGQIQLEAGGRAKNTRTHFLCENEALRPN